jgi:hypothetical protein
MQVYHGSNRELEELNAGSWVTDDVNAAWEFAHDKTAEKGGTATVLALEVGEDDVEWDVIAMAAGVEDERGVLKHAMPVVVLPTFAMK